MHLPYQNFAFTAIVIFEIQCSSVDFMQVIKLNYFIPTFHTDQSRARKHSARAWHNKGHLGAFSGRMERKATCCSHADSLRTKTLWN